jgi:hypothetical protein
VLEAASHEEAVGAIMTLQWAWDRRKTKQDTKERSMQDAGQRVFNALQNVLSEDLEGGVEAGSNGGGGGDRTAMPDVGRT